MRNLPALALLASVGALAFVIHTTDRQARESIEHAERLAAMQADIRRQERAPDIVTHREMVELPDGTTCERVTVISNGWNLSDCIRPGDPLPTMKPGPEEREQGAIPVVDTGVAETAMRIATACAEPDNDQRDLCEELGERFGVDSWAEIAKLRGGS